MDDLRTAHLLGGAEIAATREMARAATVRPVPSLPSRVLQRVLMKRGRLTVEGEVIGPMVAARRSLPGVDPAAPPRVLLRFDEVPNYQAEDRPDDRGASTFLRFHAVLSEAGVPYCAAVLPRVPRQALDPQATGHRAWTDEERDLLRLMRSDGVELALHGFDHRTRFADPRRHSELVGLDRAALTGLLDRGAAVLEEEGIRPRIFIPPFNRFSAAQYGVLAGRFEVVCGGPETVALMGFHPSPQVRGNAVYLPCYAPFYGPAREVATALRPLVEGGAAGIWLPVALHLPAELDDGFEGLRELAALCTGGVARPWEELLDAHVAARKAVPG